MKVVCISLPSRPDRQQRALEAFPGASIVDAIMMGEHIAGPLTRGELGCFFSHRQAIQRIASSHAGEKMVMVIEDDCAPLSWSLVFELLRHVPRDADAVSLGCNFRNPTEFRAVAPGLVDPSGVDLYGAHCIVYTVQGIQKLPGKLASVDIPDTPFDLWLSRNARLYIAYPPIAFPRNLSDSDTQRVR